MQQFKPLLWTICVCSFVSCQNQRSLSSSGYEFIQHTKNSQKLAQETDRVFFHIDTYLGSQLAETSRHKKNPASMVLRGNTQSPIEEALMQMGEGDSLSVFVQIDTLYPNYVIDISQKELEYRIKLLEIEHSESTENKRTASN